MNEQKENKNQRKITYDPRDHTGIITASISVYDLQCSLFFFIFLQYLSV